MQSANASKDHDHVSGELDLPRDVHVEADQANPRRARRGVRVRIHERREHAAVEAQPEPALQGQLDAPSGADREPDLVVAFRPVPRQAQET